MVLLKSTSIAYSWFYWLLLVIAQFVLQLMEYIVWLFHGEHNGFVVHFSRNCDKPRLIEALKTKRIRDIACGSSHSAAITSSGELYTWGLGEYGRLGHGDNTTQLKPKMVKSMFPVSDEIQTFLTNDSNMKLK